MVAMPLLATHQVLCLVPWLCAYRGTEAPSGKPKVMWASGKLGFPAHFPAPKDMDVHFMSGRRLLEFPKT